MNNQPKILLSVQGIEGGTLRPIGKKRVKWSITKKNLDSKYHGKDAFKPIRKGHVDIPDFEEVSCQQTIKLTQDAYDYMTSPEQPYWFKGPWKLMTKKQRLEAHLQRICDDRGGTSYIYSILED
jgi:hypothetical protein|nr:MAG TPA: hypothetical protein [Crassvirales sp.]